MACDVRGQSRLGDGISMTRPWVKAEGRACLDQRCLAGSSANPGGPFGGPRLSKQPCCGRAAGSGTILNLDAQLESPDTPSR